MYAFSFSCMSCFFFCSLPYLHLSGKLFGCVYWYSDFTLCVCRHSHVVSFTLFFSLHIYISLNVSVCAGMFSELNGANETLCKCLFFKCSCSFSWDSDQALFYLYCTLQSALCFCLKSVNANMVWTWFLVQIYISFSSCILGDAKLKCALRFGPKRHSF